MKVSIYYLTGNYGSLDTTLQSIQDGVLIDDAYLQADELEDRGVVLVRALYSSSAEGRQAIANGEIVVAAPEELANIGLITVDGQPFLQRVGEGPLDFALLIPDMLAKAGVGQDEDEEGEDMGDESENHQE